MTGEQLEKAAEALYKFMYYHCDDTQLAHEDEDFYELKHADKKYYRRHVLIIIEAASFSEEPVKKKPAAKKGEDTTHFATEIAKGSPDAKFQKDYFIVVTESDGRRRELAAALWTDGLHRARYHGHKLVGSTKDIITDIHSIIAVRNRNKRLEKDRER